MVDALHERYCGPPGPPARPPHRVWRWRAWIMRSRATLPFWISMATVMPDRGWYVGDMAASCGVSTSYNGSHRRQISSPGGVIASLGTHDDSAPHPVAAARRFYNPPDVRGGHQERHRRPSSHCDRLGLPGTSAEYDDPGPLLCDSRLPPVRQADPDSIYTRSRSLTIPTPNPSISPTAWRRRSRRVRSLEVLLVSRANAGWARRCWRPRARSTTRSVYDLTARMRAFHRTRARRELETTASTRSAFSTAARSPI